MTSNDDRSRHLVDVAMATFAQHGFHATSMRDLSRNSGMSLAGIYHYVRSKHELLFLIQDRCFKDVQAGAEAAVAGAGTAEDRVRAFIKHHVVFFARHMDQMKVLSHEDDELEGTMRQRIQERKRTYVRMLVGLLEDVRHRDVDTTVAAYGLFGMMNWIYTWYRPGGTIDPDSLADDLAGLFLHGYLPAAHPAADLVATHGG